MKKLIGLLAVSMMAIVSCKSATKTVVINKCFEYDDDGNITEESLEAVTGYTAVQEAVIAKYEADRKWLADFRLRANSDETEKTAAEALESMITASNESSTEQRILCTNMRKMLMTSSTENVAIRKFQSAKESLQESNELSADPVQISHVLLCVTDDVRSLVLGPAMIGLDDKFQFVALRD